ncbi:P-loop containing nucleoside triphosphate hydrolase protein [Decorospora gaudefroyi]|uniref:P-loop containing nucleoside triphosphate hydrolase protein n=1 Tax=Decorospora gaudefroyi TaxID=184978 RepID=A0A6A5KDF7_9PLEO|nr:P-loop containing nucleoside triphosphate hydrolase protein [Decorospora gaudefroyi]
MIVNVVFPIRGSLIQSQRRALLDIHLQLGRASTPRHQDGVNEFGESPGTKYATTPTTKPDCHVTEPHNDWTRRILFPTEADGNLQTKLRPVPHRKLFDHDINYEQAHAVNDVCSNLYGTLPYLISGPPGTGKTKTLVETAMQLLNTTTANHMLICAPSEAAADTLALRLKLYLSTKQLLRLNRPGRADNEVPAGLLQYCYIENDMFYLPPFRDIMGYNVVVTSCRDAAILAEAHLTNSDLWTMQRNMASAFNPEEPARVPPLHWTALLLDEAAQATEPDVLPAISVVSPPPTYPSSSPQPRFVMAGDEHQLGPRTASRNPQFSTSLFARLSNRSLYKTHPLSRQNTTPSSGPPVLKRSMLPLTYPPFTLLLRNYRSHPAILSVPSSLFYSNTLIPQAHTPNTPLQSSPLWRGRSAWPLLFLPHYGTDELERDGSAGWYNPSEARIACALAQQLIHQSAVHQSDICIMAPFAAQVKRLRALLRAHGLWDVNTGPLEAFQGLEKRVVILCTTRTRLRFLAHDVASGVGIVGQRQKMNVALTRAKEGLVVLGCPDVLGTDEWWRAWMAFCWRNGAVGGEWEGPREGGVVGVLERALLAKEGQGGKRVLGAKADDGAWSGEYEEWVEGLRGKLEEEEQEEGERNEKEDDRLENRGRE